MKHAADIDTIAAIASPPGRGALGIVRVSGPLVPRICEALAGPLPPPRQAVLRSFRDADGERIDQGLLLYFPAPRSFTGEDVLELQGHGGPLLLSLLLQAACAAGARPARPGEFSERAFLNGRIDLAQAEAVADLIDASSRGAARAALHSLQGEFSKRVQGLLDELIAVRADLEAALDFADEDVPWITPQTLHDRIAGLVEITDELKLAAQQGRRLREGLTVAIAGRPNVGKSTLLNRLAGAEAAIVSPHAGTTRDLLREHLSLDGLPLTVIDTAGLRDSDDPVEREGVRRAWTALGQAELILFVADDSENLTAEDTALLARLPPGIETLLLFNKCDLSGRRPKRSQDPAAHVSLRLSAAQSMGLDLLSTELKRVAGFSPANAEGIFSARARHLEALHRAQAALRLARAHAAKNASPELIAEELRLSQQALDEITGRFGSEDLLGRIFSSFCIGK
jgi:tRNA modification GTPase